MEEKKKFILETIEKETDEREIEMIYGILLRLEGLYEYEEGRK